MSITYYHCDEVSVLLLDMDERQHLHHMLMIHCEYTPNIIQKRLHPQQWQRFDPQFVEWMTERGWWNHIHVDCGGNDIHKLEQLVQYAAYIFVFVPTVADATLFKLRWS